MVLMLGSLLLVTQNEHQVTLQLVTLSRNNYVHNSRRCFLGQLVLFEFVQGGV